MEMDFHRTCMYVDPSLTAPAAVPQVLALPPCKRVRSAGGQLVFAGPRVRMGVHWAQQGTVAHRLHALTRHRVFAGEA